MEQQDAVLQSPPDVKKTPGCVGAKMFPRLKERHRCKSKRGCLDVRRLRTLTTLQLWGRTDFILGSRNIAILYLTTIQIRMQNVFKSIFYFMY